jgi:hypothetical protein
VPRADGVSFARRLSHHPRTPGKYLLERAIGTVCAYLWLYKEDAAKARELRAHFTEDPKLARLWDSACRHLARGAAERDEKRTLLILMMAMVDKRNCDP